MAKYDGIKGQELLDIEIQGNELTFIFKDNRYLFVKNEVINYFYNSAKLKKTY